MFWDGALIAQTGTSNGPMLKYSFSGLVASANATLLQLHGYNSLNKHMSFDDFSVTSVAGLPPPGAPTAEPEQAVAEPAGLALLLAGIGALVVATRRRSQPAT